MNADDPVMSRAPSGEQKRPEWSEQRIETTLTNDIFEDAIVAARTRGFKSRQDWLRWVIVKELRGEIGLLRLRTGIGDDQPETFR